MRRHWKSSTYFNCRLICIFLRRNVSEKDGCNNLKPHLQEIGENQIPPFIVCYPLPNPRYEFLKTLICMHPNNHRLVCWSSKFPFVREKFIKRVRMCRQSCGGILSGLLLRITLYRILHESIKNLQFLIIN